MNTIYKFRLWLFTIMVMAAASAVGQDFEVTGLDKLVIFPASGGEQTFWVVNYTTINWYIKCDSSWVEISPEEGLGSQEIVITVKENPKEEERKAIINLYHQKDEPEQDDVPFKQFEIVQDDKRILWNVKHDNITNFLAGGGTQYFEIEANVNWTATSSEAWAKCDPEEGNGSKIVSVIVEPYSGEQPRTAEITVNGGSDDRTERFTITQDGKDIIWNVKHNDIKNFLAGGGTQYFEIEANVNWTATSSEAWAKCDPEKGNGSKNVSVIVEPYSGEQPRTAEITVNGGSEERTERFTITQDGRSNFEISFTDNNDNEIKNITLGKEANEKYEFGISATDDEWEIIIQYKTKEKDWIKIDSLKGKGKKSGIVLTTLEKNPSLTSRSATLTANLIVNGETKKSAFIDVIQRGQAYLRFKDNSGETVEDNLELHFTVRGGEDDDRKFSIESNTKWNVSVTDWLSLVSESTGEGDGVVQLKADQNTLLKNRELNVNVTFKNDLNSEVAKTVKIIQDAYPDKESILKGMTFSINSSNDNIARTPKFDESIIIESETDKVLNLEQVLTKEINPNSLSDKWNFEWENDGVITPKEKNTDIVSLKVTYKDDPSIELTKYEYTLYPAPKSPTQLVQKGNGTSGIMIAVIDESDNNLNTFGYEFGFKYGNTELGTTTNRYWQYTDGSMTDNSDRWVYTRWKIDGRWVKGMQERNAKGQTRATRSESSTQNIKSAIGNSFVSINGGRLIAHAESLSKAIVTVIATNGTVVKRMEYPARCDYDEPLDLSGLVYGLYIVRCDIGILRTEEKIVIK